MNNPKIDTLCRYIFEKCSTAINYISVFLVIKCQSISYYTKNKPKIRIHIYHKWHRKSNRMFWFVEQARSTKNPMAIKMELSKCLNIVEKTRTKYLRLKFSRGEVRLFPVPGLFFAGPKSFLFLKNTRFKVECEQKTTY